MRLVNLIVLIAATMLSGCIHSPPMAHTPTPAPAHAFTPPLQPHQMLMTTRGTTTSPDGVWQLVVSEADGSLQLSRLGGSSMKLGGGWKAQPGWFAFIENEARVWTYNGDRALKLMIATPGQASVSGPPFPCAVPPPVFLRLSEPAKRALKLPDPFILQ